MLTVLGRHRVDYKCVPRTPSACLILFWCSAQWRNCLTVAIKWWQAPSDDLCTSNQLSAPEVPLPPGCYGFTTRTGSKPAKDQPLIYYVTKTIPTNDRELGTISHRSLIFSKSAQIHHHCLGWPCHLCEEQALPPYICMPPSSPWYSEVAVPQ